MKRIVLLQIFVFILTFSGCSGKIPTSLQFSCEINLKGCQPLLMENDLLLCEKDTTASNRQTDSADMEYFVVDLSSGEWRSVGMLNDATTSSGTSCLLPMEMSICPIRRRSILCRCTR